MKKKKILVTGATGFIGTYVIRELLKYNDFEIIASSRNKEKASKLDWYSKVKYLEFDLKIETDNLFSYFNSPDLIIHLAWEGLSNYNDSIHIEKNLINSYRFLKIFIENGVSDITCIGTCFEYGMQNGKLSENDSPNPNTSYGIAKDSLRKFLQILQKENTFNMKWIRLFYTYGEGQNENSLFGQLNKAIKDNNKIFNMSKGEQLRDYLHINTVAKYICAIALQNNINGIINCGSGTPCSIRKFTEEQILLQKSNLTLNLGYYDYPIHEPMAFWADTTKLNLIKN